MATITGLPAGGTARTMRFCIAGTCSAGISTPRSPRATITASDCCDDLVQALDRRRLLDLGDDAGAALRRCALTSTTSSARCTNDSAIQSTPSVSAEVEVGAVLLGQRRHRQHDAGHVHALAVRQHAADHDARLGEVGAERLDLQSQLAVVEQQIRRPASAPRRSPDAAG